jgi:hypothetical protein
MHLLHHARLHDEVVRTVGREILSPTELLFPISHNCGVVGNPEVKKCPKSLDVENF